MRAPRTVIVVTAFLTVLTLAAGWGVAFAEDKDKDKEEAPAKRPQLTEHPLKDAKPGEYLRFVVEGDGWKKHYVERIVDVRDGKVLIETSQTDPEGKDQGTPSGRWKRIPKLKPAEWQRVLEDKMVELEVNGKKLWCRQYHIEQPQNPPVPVPLIRRTVWYTNDVPCSGKVKEWPSSRLVTDWGMMSEEDLKKRQEAHKPKPK